MIYQAVVKLENHAVIYRLRWEFWTAATFVPPTRTASRAAMILHLIMWTRTKSNDGWKEPNGHWNTTELQDVMSTQKTRKWASWIAQNIGQISRWRGKTLKWLVEQIPKLEKVELHRNEFVNYRNGTLWLPHWGLDRKLTHTEMSVLRKHLEAENLNDSQKQTLFNKMEQLLQKLDTKQSQIIQFMKPDVGIEVFGTFSDDKRSYQALLKQLCQTAESENQTSLVSSTYWGERYPNQTIIDPGTGAIARLDGNGESSSKLSAIHGIRKQPRIANTLNQKTTQYREKATDRRNGARKRES